MAVPILARAMFGLVDWAARKGLGGFVRSAGTHDAARQQGAPTGVRGETYAYWYLRRNGYVMIARNFTYRGMKGEIDLVGYDGETLAFVEVKTRTSTARRFRLARRCGHRRESSSIFRAWPGNSCANIAPATPRSVLTFLRLKPRPASGPSFACIKALLPRNENLRVVPQDYETCSVVS